MRTVAEKGEMARAAPHVEPWEERELLPVEGAQHPAPVGHEVVLGYPARVRDVPENVPEGADEHGALDERVALGSRPQRGHGVVRLPAQRHAAVAEVLPPDPVEHLERVGAFLGGPRALPGAEGGAAAADVHHDHGVASGDPAGLRGGEEGTVVRGAALGKEKVVRCHEQELRREATP